MSIIGTIRDKFAWLLLLLVGFAIFAFVALDPNASITDLFGNSAGTVGKVEGGKITAMDLLNKRQDLKEIYPGANDDQIQNLAWNELVDERLFDERYHSLGLNVTKQELADLIKGANPHPYAMQIFSSISPTGQYNQVEAMQIVDDPSSHPQGMVIVEQLKHSITDAQMNQKYSALLDNAVNTPTWLAKSDFAKEYKTVDFDYVFLPYSLVEDSEIEITDADLLAYAKKNKGKYEADNGIIFQYVPFDKAPSPADSTAQLLNLQNSKEAFKNSDNPELFARDKSNSTLIAQMFSPTVEYQTSSTINLNDDRKNQILNANVGDVVGPFKANGELVMVKIEDKKTVADSARVRHILLQADFSNPAAYTETKALADSLAGELKRNKSKFDAFVTEYSSDPGSKNNGGVYDYFPQGRMVPTFNDASFNGNIGEIQVVETSYGFHIVEPLARKGRSTGVKVVPLIQRVSASKETRDAVYETARSFEQVANTEEGFEKESEEYGGYKTTASIDPNAQSVAGIGQSFELMRWANNGKVGDVKYFNDIDGRAFVVRIGNKTEKGELDIESNRATITNAVRNEKKAAILKQRISENGGASQSLSELAPKLGRTVQSATEAKFGQSGTGVGFEPELISSLFFLSEGHVDKSIQGRRGVYVVDIKNFSSVPAQTEFDQYKTTRNGQLRRNATVAAVRNSLIESGKIADERYKTR